MQQTTIANIKAGEYFKRKPDAKTVYIRDAYCRESRKYQCVNTNDVWGNGLLLKGTTPVYVGFTY